MIDRESILPLTIGAIFAVAVHFGGSAGYVKYGWGNSQDGAPALIPPIQEKPEAERNPEPPKERRKDEEIPIGQKEPSELSINWISVETFEKLLAEKAPFDQAAVQKQVEPVKIAQAPLEPTPPLPAPSEAPAPPSPPATNAEPDQVETPPKIAAAPAPPQEDEPVPPSRIERKGEEASETQVATGDSPSEKPVAAPRVESAEAPEIALATPKVASNPSQDPELPEPVASKPSDSASRRSPKIEPDESSDPDDKTREVDAPEPEPRRLAALPLSARVEELIATMPARRPTPQKVNEPSPVQEREPSPPRPDAAATRPRPTAAPKDDREAVPVSRDEMDSVRIGSVLARQGVEVKTIHPRWKIQALLTNPAPPEVEVAFDRSGKVVSARLVQSTGYANVDSPLLSSLYRWTAEGPRLKELPENGRLTMQIRILWPE